MRISTSVFRFLSDSRNFIIREFTAALIVRRFTAIVIDQMSDTWLVLEWSLH